MNLSDLAMDFAADASLTDSDFSSMQHGDIAADEVRISPKASQIIGKPAGRYITLTFVRDNVDFGDLSALVHKYARQAVNIEKIRSAMVLGLGNEELSADRFGALASKGVRVGQNRVNVASVASGVMGQTGIDSGDMAAALVDLVKPDLLVMLDALLTSEPARMLSSVQISDAPLPFGSGTGSRREVLAKLPGSLAVLSVGYATSARARLGESGEEIVVTPADADIFVARTAGCVSDALNELFGEVS